MNILIVLPILIPLFTGILTILMPGRTQKLVSITGAFIYLVCSVLLGRCAINDGIQVMHIGNWPAPFGISFVVDIFSSIMIFATGLTGFVISLFVYHNLDEERHRFGFNALLHFLLMGVSGAFITGDIFNMYVWFEVLLISSFVLTALGGERAQIEGAVKYVTINLMSSTFFLIGIALLYSNLGTLNLADLAVEASEKGHNHLIVAASLLLLIAFGIKAGVFPLYFWLPASYHTPPAAVTALFAGLLTKVGVYSLIRIFTLIFAEQWDFLYIIFAIIAGATMFFGVIGAAVQYNFRRLLSFHIISQIGYMIMGLALFTKLALAGAVFFLFHNIVVKMNLFLISGFINHFRKTFDLKKLGGLFNVQPFLAALFMISAFALAGIPPLSGFWAKFLLVRGGLDAGAIALVVTSLVVSMLTLFSMTKIWSEVFWKKDPSGENKPFEKGRAYYMQLAPILFLTAIVLLMSLYTEPFLDIAFQAADQLKNPQLYIEAVLERGPR